MVEDARQEPEIVQVIKLTTGDTAPELSHERTARRNRRLTNLMNELPAVLRDVGCTCLAKKLSLYYDEMPEGTDAKCCTTPSQRSTLHLMCQLRPLSKALREAGYLDHALSCAELARSIEPTMDLNLLRAYLLLALGDNEQACRIYRIAIRKLGCIPQCEIERLESLAKSHAVEEDLAEIIGEIKACNLQTQ